LKKEWIFTGNFKEKIINLIDRYFSELMYAHATFETYYLLKFGSKKFEKAYGISPAFFSLVRKSLFSESVMTLCKFMEGHNRSDLNLNKFLEKLKNNKEIFNGLKHDEDIDLEESYDKYKVQISNYEVLIKNLLSWRDKMIAHFDKGMMEDSISEVKVSAEDIRELIDFIGGLLNYYMYKIEKGKIVSYKYTNFDDVNKLINFVARHDIST
jgi:hypothetical protein